ncbi:Uncharacterized protein HZ326_27838 [Fusarium oxysporum f. sp. albedinis]|nr:Uncharacterized protein HZ326_27838 [Fusarium oxysporum f. sp. albedinis]
MPNRRNSVTDCSRTSRRSYYTVSVTFSQYGNLRLNKGYAWLRKAGCMKATEKAWGMARVLYQSTHTLFYLEDFASVAQQFRCA